MMSWPPTAPPRRDLLAAVACLVLAFALAGCAEGPSGSLRSDGARFVGDWNATTPQPDDHAELSIQLPDELAGSTVWVSVNLETARRTPVPSSAEGDAICRVSFFHGTTLLLQSWHSHGVSSHSASEPAGPWSNGGTVNATMPTGEPLLVHLDKDYARDIRASLDCSYDVTTRGQTHVVITFGPLVVTWGN